MDVFRIFDAMNDIRNMEQAIKATIAVDKHAQGAISYTLSPVHNTDYWLNLAKRLEDLGSHSICIKDMAGLLTPYAAEELVGRLKESIAVPIALHSHATTGMSTATIVKAAEAGVGMVDAAISTMSHTTGHSATESVIAIMDSTDRATGLDIERVEEIADYFRPIRRKYAKFEGSTRGVDSRILVAQVPGGMLSNMESQLKEQGALDKMADVLKEIPKVRKELGYLALVTPTSQIVGTQAVFNVMMGERYKTITKETRAVLRGEYGLTPAPVDEKLQARVLDEGEAPITCRPADQIEPEMDKLTAELEGIAAEKGITLADQMIEDVLIYALFPQVGLKFLENRGNPDAFEPVPSEQDALPAAPAAGPAERYRVTVDGTAYDVQVEPNGQATSAQPAVPAPVPAAGAAPGGGGVPLPSPLAGNVWKVKVTVGNVVQAGDVVVILEAMKMETEIRALNTGRVTAINVQEGAAVHAGDALVTIG